MSLGSLYAYCNNSPTNFTDAFGSTSVGLDGSSINARPAFSPIYGIRGPIGGMCAGFWRTLWNTICGRGRDESKDKDDDSSGYSTKHTSTNADGSENYDIYYNGKKVGEGRSWPGTGHYESGTYSNGSFYLITYGDRTEINWLSSGSGSGPGGDDWMSDLHSNSAKGVGWGLLGAGIGFSGVGYNAMGCMFMVQYCLIDGMFCAGMAIGYGLSDCPNFCNFIIPGAGPFTSRYDRYWTDYWGGRGWFY